jgi:hypothetical protein
MSTALTQLMSMFHLLLQKDRLGNFKAFISRAKLKILGSQFFVPKVLAALLSTIPPIEVVLETLTIKFVLKGLSAMAGAVGVQNSIKWMQSRYTSSHTTSP